MAFPQWTEIYNDDIDAIQYLRLNELRDHINEVLFPYLTTITPYCRLVSWLTWIYTQLSEEIQRNSELTLLEYRRKFLRTYGIMATANILYANTLSETSWGPISVLSLRNALESIEGDEIDFSHPNLSKPVDPTPNYRTSIIRMGLFSEGLQPISQRRYFSVLIPTDLGHKLSDVFENFFSDLIDPEEFMNRLVWKKDLLEEIGNRIFLQGLTPDCDESRILITSIKTTMKYKNFYDEFKNIILKIIKKCKIINYYDASIAALHKEVLIDDKLIETKLFDSETLALLAYHELHTHFSYGADAILNGLVELAELKGSSGISKSDILGNVIKYVKKIPWIKKDSYLSTIVGKIINSFTDISGKYLLKKPPLLGPFGFRTLQDNINNSTTKYEQIMYGSIILLQSALFQRSFKKEWLNNILEHHREVFSAYTLLEEYDSLNQNSSFIKWVETSVNAIIFQHDKVSESKGVYSKRFQKSGETIYHLADADYGFQRGRLQNAVIWVSDLGIIKRTENYFEFAGDLNDKYL